MVWELSAPGGKNGLVVAKRLELKIKKLLAIEKRLKVIKVSNTALSASAWKLSRSDVCKRNV